MGKKYALLFLLIIIPGCSFHKYIVPPHPLPAQFTNQYTASDKKTLIDWWLQFNDPTLNSLIAEAIEYNYDLRIAREKIKEAREFYNIKKSELFPRISGFSDAQRIRISPQVQNFLVGEEVPGSFAPVGLPGATSSFFDIGFDALWEIDFWGKIWHEKNARFYAFEAQIEQMHSIYIILLADVARTYIQLCALKNLIDLALQIVNLELELVVLQKDLFVAGLSSEIEVTTQQQAADTANNQLKSLQTAAVQTKNKLAILVGQNPENLTVEIKANTIPLSTTPLQVGLPSDLLKQRPDIRQAERELASSHASVARAIADWFPSFSLFGGLSSQTTKANKLLSCGSMSWFIGPSARWPLIDFGRIRANVNTQKSIERQAALTYSQTIITALKEVEDFLIAYSNNTEQVAILTHKKNKAIKEQLLLQDKYDSGLISKQELLSALKNSLSVTGELITTQESLSNILVSLYKALGGGW